MHSSPGLTTSYEKQAIAGAYISAAARCVTFVAVAPPGGVGRHLEMRYGGSLFDFGMHVWRAQAVGFSWDRSRWREGFVSHDRPRDPVRSEPERSEDEMAPQIDDRTERIRTDF